MRKREIDRGCKIINEFMHPKVDGVKYFVPKGFMILIPNYYNSWDALIPVAQKCIDTYHDHGGDIFKGLHECNKDALFIAIIIFIKWCKAHPENIGGYAETKPFGKVEKLLWK